MPIIRHINLSDFIPYCLSGNILVWDEREDGDGVKAHLLNDDRNFVSECDSIALANTLMLRYPAARQCQLRDLNEVFEKLSCPIGLAGSSNMIVFVEGLHKRNDPVRPSTNFRWPSAEQGRSLRSWKEWLAANCRGNVCILNGTYQRRLSFAHEEDFILAKMMFA